MESVPFGVFQVVCGRPRQHLSLPEKYTASKSGKNTEFELEPIFSLHNQAM